jgi:5-methyltetrahydrofolate--homocysteine methyltransferase
MLQSREKIPKAGQNMKTFQELNKEKILIIDGAMGTELQNIDIPDSVWEGKEGCNELLNETLPSVVQDIHEAYLTAGADIIKTNTFGSMPWVLDEYQISEHCYKNSLAGAKITRAAVDKFNSSEKPRFVAGAIGPGTKLPSLGHIEFPLMYSGYKITAEGLIDGGVDLFLLETCQDPLQIKAALLGIQDAMKNRNVDMPIMVSVTMELSGSMLIGTDAETVNTILEPFSSIYSVGFNCGTGPKEYVEHLNTLSSVSTKPISIHANAGLPDNVGGMTVYPMGPQEFAQLQTKFAKKAGVAILGGCCGTTPKHIEELYNTVKDLTPIPASGSSEPAIASLFGIAPLSQEPAPFLIGERANATGSKAFRELLLEESYDQILSVGQEQVRNGAHGLDVSVGFAGRDETRDMHEVMARYAQKINLPIMPDSTQLPALEAALQHIGGKAIINSVNLEDGEEKFDEVCQLAVRYGASLVCLTIDEKGMAKTRQEKVDIAERIYERATKLHGIKGHDLVFDLLTFTVGSGDDEYFTAAIETIEAIREVRKRHPEVGAVLGVSNISFGLAKHARFFLNSVFVHHCVEAGLTMAIVNVKHTLPMHKINDDDRIICENLLFNKRGEGIKDPLFAFIDYFSDKTADLGAGDDEAFQALSDQEKIHKLLIDGDKERMIPLIEKARHEIDPDTIVNEILINAMKEVGVLFGSGQMQLPFVLQSAETMKTSVDYLNPYLPKQEKQVDTTLVIGTVKGDVHDVGKNLVDIILSNNGFKVINIGIKATLNQFLTAAKEHNAAAIGMSGLLVKSTLAMKENLIEMKEQGLDIPILLGGAALTTDFINNFCRTNYDGPIFYCKDAFDGITAMSRIEKADDIQTVDVHLGGKKQSALDEEPKPKEILPIPFDQVTLPENDHQFSAPFLGRHVFNDFDPELAFSWINHRLLFKTRWGYNAKNMTKDEYNKMVDEKVQPAYDRLKKEFLEKDLFQPTVIYGYYPCRADDNTLLIFDPKDGIDNNDPLESIREKATHQFTFPRQQKNPHRALSDYFHSDRHDVVALSIVSAGSAISEYEKVLYAEGKFHEYYLVHGLGVELAEALAEIVHKKIRIELDILKNELPDLNEVKMKGYHGARYSFGYTACPDLELNEPLFELLKPEEFGIELSETFQIHPEQSTSALVVPNKSALYYNL